MRNCSPSPGGRNAHMTQSTYDFGRSFLTFGINLKQQAPITLSNAFDWHRDIPWWDTEMGNDSGARTESIGSQTERTPGPATLRLALRVTF